jgi:hypothetical protein
MSVPQYRAEKSDLVDALVQLRTAITPLVEDLVGGLRPSVECWLAFADLISNIIPLVRQNAHEDHYEMTKDESCARR